MALFTQLLTALGISQPALIVAILLVYVTASTIFIVTERREPKSTLAWLLMMLLFPGVGVLAYLFFGRGARAFGAEKSLRQKLLDSNTTDTLKRLLQAQTEELQHGSRLTQLEHRTVRLLVRNSASLLTLDNRVELLQNASRKYPRLLEDLAAAQHSISIQYYSWETDAFTEKLADVLCDRVKAGVQVRVLYDWLGSYGAIKPAYIKRLRDAGVRIEAYLFHKKLHDIGYRNHRKIVVVDGRIGFTGGMNMAEEHLTGGKHFKSWRDTAIRIEGDAVIPLQLIFAAGWYNTVGERMDDPSFYRPNPPPPAANGVPMQIVSAGPDSEWGAIRQTYFRLIANAQRHIYIQSPFFILDESLSEALKAACLGGVDVRIMLQPRGGVFQVPYRAGLTFCDEIARAGGKIYFYQAGYLHAKTMAIDGSMCSIGTANFDTRSTGINYECNAIIYDDAFTSRLEQDFIADLDKCSEFSPFEYRRRSRWSRFVDSTYRLLSPLL
jgi:cardiolipin synthase A/B